MHPHGLVRRRRGLRARGVLYLLHLLKDTKQDLGLYRDDMLGVTRLTERSLEKMKQKIQVIFQEAGSR